MRSFSFCLSSQYTNKSGRFGIVLNFAHLVLENCLGNIVILVMLEMQPNRSSERDSETENKAVGIVFRP